MIKRSRGSAVICPTGRFGALLVSFLTMVLLLSAARADQPSQEPVLTVVIPPLEETSIPHTVYFPRLLELALSKTEASHGPYSIQAFPYLWTNGRFITDLKRSQNIDLLWTQTDSEIEKGLIRIPVPLLRGLNDHRVFLIREEDREHFAKIGNLEQLRELKAGQGHHWVDTDVLNANKLSVVTSAHYELLFGMLAAGRFDYFPRGLHEIWDEYEQHKDKRLSIESSLMLRYPAEMYFFVNAKDTELAERVEAGLKLAAEDGSLDELFFSIPGFKRGYQEISIPSG